MRWWEVELGLRGVDDNDDNDIDNDVEKVTSTHFPLRH